MMARTRTLLYMVLGVAAVLVLWALFTQELEARVT